MSDDVRSPEIAGLIARAADGGISLDERLKAFGQVVQYYQKMAYGCAYAILGDFHLAEDAAQEAFLIAYRRLADLREAKAFSGWLRRIVTNYCLAQVRRRGVSAVSLVVVPEPQASEPPDEGADDAAGRDAVTALRSLPEDQREAMALFYVDGYSQQEIATFLEIPGELAVLRPVPEVVADGLAGHRRLGLAAGAKAPRLLLRHGEASVRQGQGDDRSAALPLAGAMTAHRETRARQVIRIPIHSRADLMLCWAASRGKIVEGTGS